MGEAARQLDTIDVRPVFTAEDAAAMEARYAGVPTQEMLHDVLTGELRGRIAAVSSFGAESATTGVAATRTIRGTPDEVPDPRMRTFTQQLSY